MCVHIKSTDPILSTQSYDFLWAHWKRRKKGFHHQKERDCYLAACLWQKSNLIHCSAYWFHTYLVTIYTSPITTSRYHKSFDNSFPILKVYIIQKRNTLLPYRCAIDFCNYLSSLMNLIFSLFQTWISQATACKEIKFKLRKKWKKYWERNDKLKSIEKTAWFLQRTFFILPLFQNIKFLIKYACPCCKSKASLKTRFDFKKCKHTNKEFY